MKGLPNNPKSGPKININPINDLEKGQLLLIDADTNLAVDDVIFLEIKYIEPDPVKGIHQNEIIFESRTQVIKGMRGLNILSMSVDTASFQRGKYSLKLFSRTINA